MENFPCFTIFYAVDTHIHSWYPYYAQGFDACLVSLKDDIPLFRDKTLASKHVYWSPPFAKDDDVPKTIANEDKSWDCLFVGNVDAQTTPERQAFLENLQKYVPIHITRGHYKDLFPQGKVILNYCEHGDLNFRNFEALACGSALLSPFIDNGFSEIFTSNVHLLSYDRHNIQDAVTKIKMLLTNEDKRNSLATKGFKLVDTAHRAKHRAKLLADFLHELGKDYQQQCIKKRRKYAADIRKQWLRAPYLLLAQTDIDDNFRKAYLDAAKGLL